MSRYAIIVLSIVATLSCEDPARAPAPAPPPVELAAPMEPLEPRVVEPAPPEPARLSRATTLANAGAAQCTIGAPVPTFRAADLWQPWIAATESGGLLAARGGREILIQPLNADGSPDGPVRELGLRSAISITVLEAIEGRYVLSVRARCRGGQTCGHVYTLNARGEVLSGPVQTAPDATERPFAAAQPRSLADDGGGRAHLWWRIDARRRIGLAHRVLSVSQQGAPVAGPVHDVSQFGCLGSSMTAAITASSPEHFAAIYGTRGPRAMFGHCEGPPRRRFLTTDGRAPVPLEGVGQAVRDLAWQGDALHVMFETRDGELRSAQLASDGSLVADATPVDTTLPLPAPFTHRVLPRLHYGPGRRATASLRRFRSSGARIGEPIELGPGQVAMTFTGRRFLVARIERGAAPRVHVRTIDCRQNR